MLRLLMRLCESARDPTQTDTQIHSAISPKTRPNTKAIQSELLDGAITGSAHGSRSCGSQPSACDCGRKRARALASELRPHTHTETI